MNIEIHDSGSWQGGSTPTSGLGIELMHGFVDSVAIAYGRRGTRVHFRQMLDT
ncbi:MAG TPA: ATP-binding protein [Pseudonocardia sp.]